MKKMMVLLVFMFTLGVVALPGVAKADPVGTVISYYGTTAPDGYFVCNGASFDAEAFPKLRAVLGSNVLPDLRGYFVRGYDTRNTVDPDGATRALGSLQNNAMIRLTGSFTARNSAGDTPEKARGVFYATGSSAYVVATGTGALGIVYFDSNKQAPGATEIRPKNKTLLYCIKHDESDVPGPAIIPDLRLGQETLWPARYEGKQVYAKLVNFGALPAGYGLRMVTHDIQDVDWIQISWDYSVVRKANDANKVSLGLVSTSASAGNIRWRFLVDKNSVQAHSLTADPNTDWNGVICVLYTKTTEQPVNP